MNRIEHLLACISEEAGEAQQIVGKSLRFGIYDFNPNNPEYNNLELLRREVHDMVAVYELLCWELGKDCDFDGKLIGDKQKKVNKYIQYARNSGSLKDE